MIPQEEVLELHTHRFTLCMKFFPVYQQDFKEFIRLCTCSALFLFDRNRSNEEV